MSDSLGPAHRPSGVVGILKNMHELGTLITLAAQTKSSWLSRNSTLVVGVVGIVVSGFVGPTITGFLTARRERQRDKRGLVSSRRDDLRALLDEAATVLGAAVSNLRPLLEAEQAGREPPKEPADFLGTLFPLGQRLKLRLPPGHPVVTAYEEVRLKLLDLSKATASQTQWDAAVKDFEMVRENLLETGREAIQAPISDGEEI